MHASIQARAALAIERAKRIEGRVGISVGSRVRRRGRLLVRLWKEEGGCARR